MFVCFISSFVNWSGKLLIKETSIKGYEAWTAGLVRGPCWSITLTIIVKNNSVSSLKAISDNIRLVWSRLRCFGLTTSHQNTNYGSTKLTWHAAEVYQKGTITYIHQNGCQLHITLTIQQSRGNNQFLTALKWLDSFHFTSNLQILLDVTQQMFFIISHSILITTFHDLNTNYALKPKKVVFYTFSVGSVRF